MIHRQFALLLMVCILSSLLGGGLVVWLLIPQSVLAQGELPEVIKARSFEVVDGDGKTRVTISEHRLQMEDDYGQRVMLSMLLGPTITLVSGSNMAGMSTDSLQIVNGDAFTSAGIQSGALAVQGVGNQRAFLFGNRLILTDSTGRDRAILGTAELKDTRTGSTEISAPSSLVLFDEEGKGVWSAP